MKQQASTTKTNRRERSNAVEGEAHQIMRDRSSSIEERATRGLALLTQKLTEDIQSQYEHACDLHLHKNASAVDAEMCRLLRMMEKRKKMFDKLEAAFTLPEA